MRAKLLLGLAVVATWLVGWPTAASAQMLIWSLPEDQAAWIRFEGTYKQTRARPNSNAGDEVIEWRSELTISSLGREEAADGSGSAPVPCRWVEFKTETKPAGVDNKTGPADVYIYKVLIPEHRVIGKIIDDDTIPVTFLPIVKGYRRVGQRPVEPVKEKALAIYPTIARVTYYADLKAEGSGEPVQIGGNSVEAKLFKGSRLIKQKTTRSSNVASLWRTDEVPFGLARYHVVETTEQKGLGATDAEFQRIGSVEVDMTAVATGNDSRSELPDSK
ncbi:MAG: hypothetical protein JSS02_24870 [Planctomycetes bacterium]|nr:hypothetical protein [Planctomycetota bacterium]